MLTPVRILMLEDSPDDEVLIRRELERAGVPIGRLQRVETIGALSAALDEAEWDVALLDFNLPEAHALSALSALRARDVDLPALVVTGSLDEEVATTVFRAGARDIVLKSRLGRLGPAVRREVEELAGRRTGRLLSKRLREVEATFDAFLEHVPVGVWIASESGQVVYANAALGHLVGRPVRAIVGHAIGTVLGEEASALVTRAAARASSDRQAETTVLRIGRPDGTEPRIAQVLTFRIGDGQIGGATLDVTERHRAEHAARENEERFRAVANASSDGLMTLDADGRVVASNTALEAMLGWAASDIVGRPLSVFVDVESAAALPARLVRWLALAEHAPATYCGELVLRGTGERGIPVEVRAGTWAHRGDRYLALMLRDVTQQRKLESQLRTAQKMEAVGQLAGGIAHDFNNILAVVRAFSDLIGETFEASDDRRRDVVGMQEAVERGAVLVRQLLAFSRQQVLQPRPVPINGLVERLSAMLRRTLTERLVLETNLDPDAGCVFADPAQIEQIVMNLVVNARDAIPGRGRIVLSTRFGAAPADARTSLIDVPPLDDCVVVSVADDGIGMDAATQSRIFDPFFTTKEQGRGTGLGLATVYGIVRQSNGVIRLRSAPGEGSTFEVYLPRTSDVAVVPEAGPAPSPHARGKGETIALVEDDALVRSALARILRREGFAVLGWGTGEDAIEAMSKGARPDLVLSDVLLPGMTGVELLRALAKEGHTMPVILMSGYDGGELERDGLLTAVRLLQKPISSPALVEAVHEALDRARASRMPARGES